MPTTKDEVRKLLDNLPDDASLEDIQYHLYVREKIENGRRAVDEGRIVSEEDVARRLAKWTGE